METFANMHGLKIIISRPLQFPEIKDSRKYQKISEKISQHVSASFQKYEKINP